MTSRSIHWEFSAAEMRQNLFRYETPRCGNGVSGALACQGGVGSHTCSESFCAREKAALEQLFDKSDPEGDACISGALERGLGIHIACSFYPIGNTYGLSDVCADKAGRLYRYDHQLKALVLIFSPLSKSAAEKAA